MKSNGLKALKYWQNTQKKAQLSLTNPHNVLHCGKHAGNKHSGCSV